MDKVRACVNEETGGEKGMDLGRNCPSNWVVGGEMKDRSCRQRNEQKGHQSIRVGKWGNWRGKESKIKLGRDAKREGEKAKSEPGRSICQGKSGVFQAQCLCAIWITAGFLCLGLFYIKLRQLLDFPHYCQGIGLIQCWLMFSPSSASIRRDPLSQVAGHLSPSAHCYGGVVRRRRRRRRGH